MELSAGRASVPPRVAAFAPAGLLGAMPGYVDGVLAAKLVALFPDHEPSHQALIAVFDAETGTPLAVMDGTHITAVRTGASSAVATRALAREDARVLAVLGAGVQGRAHLDAVRRVRSSRKFGSRAGGSRARTCWRRRWVPSLSSPSSEAVRGADVVCCCTHSSEPVPAAGWLSPGRTSPRSARRWTGRSSIPRPSGGPALRRVARRVLASAGRVVRAAGARSGAGGRARRGARGHAARPRRRRADHGLQVDGPRGRGRRGGRTRAQLRRILTPNCSGGRSSRRTPRTRPRTRRRSARRSSGTASGAHRRTAGTPPAARPGTPRSTAGRTRSAGRTRPNRRASCAAPPAASSERDSPADCSQTDR